MMSTVDVFFIACRITKSRLADSKQALRETRNLSDLSFRRSQGRCVAEKGSKRDSPQLSAVARKLRTTGEFQSEAIYVRAA